MLFYLYQGHISKIAQSEKLFFIAKACIDLPPVTKANSD